LLDTSHYIREDLVDLAAVIHARKFKKG
jgi:hypothetical protein